MLIDLPGSRGQAVIVHCQGLHVATIERSNSDHQIAVTVIHGGDEETEPFGLFVTLAPDHARSVAASLLRTADRVDGGVVKQ
jgi:hypothetical protein